MKTNQKKWFDSAIIKEDPSKATANSKHFILNNGTRKAIFSPTNINYYDKADGKWKPIDNTLKSTEGGYSTHIGAYTAKFSKENKNETVEITDGAASISWEYLGTNKNVFSIRKSHTTKCKSKLNVTPQSNDALTITSSSRAIYENAEGNINIDYKIDGNGIKENIIINDVSESYKYYFLLRISDFKMKLSENGKDIKFYKVDSSEDNAPEFTMPAPFMYDANGERSDNVKFSIEHVEDESYLLSIEASSDWINSPERVFPVCIDPQLITNTTSSITVSHSRYQWQENCNGYCCNSEWVYSGSPTYDDITIYKYSNEKVDATLKIKKDNIDLTNNKLISAKLIFQNTVLGGNSAPAIIKIGSNEYYHKNNENKLIADITSLYASKFDDFDVSMQILTSGQSRKFSKSPTLEIEYQPIISYAPKKSFHLDNGATAELDIITGNSTIVFDDISDPKVGISVSHIFKPNDEFLEYGKNYRLNLDEKLENLSGTSSYVYTDSLGDKYILDEYFYTVNSEGKKSYLNVDIASIVTDDDGRLWYNETEVFREIGNNRGLKASTRLSGTNNSEWLEQRADEEKQVEEQIKSYENALCNFVYVEKDTGMISDSLTKSKISTPDNFEAFINNSGCNCASLLLLSKEEGISYKSLLTQKDSLFKTIISLGIQSDSLRLNAKNLFLQHDAPDTFAYQKSSYTAQINSLNIEKESLKIEKEKIKDINYEDRTEEQKDRLEIICDQLDNIDTQITLLTQNNENIISKQENNWNEQKLLIEKQIKNFGLGKNDDTSFPDCGLSGNGTLTRQYNNISDQKEVANEQIYDIDKQINLLIEKSINYVEQIKNYFKEYHNLKKQLDTLKEQMPVKYLISDNAVKGFNEKGELVIIQDKYDNYIVIEREKYTEEGSTRISAVYNKDGQSMKFLYNNKEKLAHICTSLGERVAFTYNTSGYLTDIVRDDLPDLHIAYATSTPTKRINKIVSFDNTPCTLAYSTDGKLTKIKRMTSVERVANDNITTGLTSILSEISVEYTSSTVKLTYDGVKQEIYKVNATTQQVKAFYEVINGKVSNAEYYTYENNLLTKTEYPHKSCFNEHGYSDFDYSVVIETVEQTSYDSFKMPISVSVNTYSVCGCNTDRLVEKIKTEYTYDDEHRLIETKKTRNYYDCCESYNTVITVEKRYYNNAGELVRKESYVKGEELKTGINIEEHIFDENGNEIKSFTYNSLDPSSKLYTENEVDKNGRAIAAFDESGEHKTTFMYGSDGVSVSAECLPNGSKLSYGSTRDGSVTSITHSTENGEENSTTQTRTLDVVTEVKSGNNTVRYEYDGKRRVKSVSLNGVDNYVRYDYSGENTNVDTVKATMLNGTEIKTVKNIYGNIAKSSCNDRSVTNLYDTKQKLRMATDSVSGQTRFSYDENGNVIAVTAPDCTEEFEYDFNENTLDKKTITINGTTHTYNYGYKLDSSRALDNIRVDGNVVRPNTDALGRNTGKTIEANYNKIAEEKISYVKFGDHATSLPSTVRFAKNGVFNESIQYRYDSMGNIIEVFENGRSTCRYEYDALGRLTREDNVAFGKTTTWAYDNNGNIIAKYEYAITTKPTNELHLLDCTCKLYTYDDNSDQLMSYGDETFAYDLIGNPTTYRGKAATWAYGRSLTAYDGNTFSYDARGRRTAKNDITFTYDSNGNLIKQSNGLEFLYDHTGVFAVKYNNATYYYRKNAQQDIIAILDNYGNVVVKYKYDTWGNCQTTVIDSTATEIATLNPFRYRSYYLDTETGFYFLKTRYYDPEIGRFMTIDDISYLDPKSINGLNLYAYCFNNPVMLTDRYGCTAWWEWLIAGVIVAGLIVGAVFTGGTLVGAVLAGAAIGAGLSLGTQALSGELNWGQFALDTGIGAITGLIGGSGVSQCISTILGGVIGAGSNLASQLIDGVSWDEISVMQILVAGTIGAASGYIGGAGARNKAAINQGKGVQNATAKLNKVVRRIANGTRYKSLTTAQIAFTNAMDGLTSAIQSQMNRMFSTAMISYGVSTAASSGIDAWFDANEYWFF